MSRREWNTVLSTSFAPVCTHCIHPEGLVHTAALPGAERGSRRCRTEWERVYGQTWTTSSSLPPPQLAHLPHENYSINHVSTLQQENKRAATYLKQSHIVVLPMTDWWRRKAKPIKTCHLAVSHIFRFSVATSSATTNTTVDDIQTNGITFKISLIAPKMIRINFK